MSVLKSVLGGLAGVVAAGLPIASVEALAHGRLQGDTLFAAVAIGYGLGALFGTAIAARIAGTKTSIAVPLLLGLLAMLNLFAFPHPWWFVPAAVLMLAAGWWTGQTLARGFSKGVV